MGEASCLAGSGWLAWSRLGTSVTCLYDCAGVDLRLVTMVVSTPVTIFSSEGANVGCGESRRGAAARLPLTEGRQAAAKSLLSQHHSNADKQQTKSDL